MISESTKILIKAAESIINELGVHGTNVDLVRSSGLDEEAWRALAQSSIMTIVKGYNIDFSDLEEETAQMLFDALLTGLAVGVRYEREVDSKLEDLFKDF